MTVKNRIDKVEEALHEGDGRVDIWIILKSEHDAPPNRCEKRRKGCPPQPCPMPDSCWYKVANPDMLEIVVGKDNDI